MTSVILQLSNAAALRAASKLDDVDDVAASVAGSVFDDRALQASIDPGDDELDERGRYAEAPSTKTSSPPCLLTPALFLSRTAAAAAHSVRYIREHVGRAQTCVDVAVPCGVRPGESFSFPLHGVSLSVKCPTGCGEGSKIRVPIPDISSIVCSTLDAAPAGAHIATQLEVLRSNVRVAVEPFADAARRRERNVMPVVRRFEETAVAAAPVVVEDDAGVESAMRKASEILRWRCYSMGGNAIVGMRYAVQSLGGLELLVAAYGTAVVLEEAAAEEAEEEHDLGYTASIASRR